METDALNILRVKDTGLGIENKNLSAIFNRFRKFNEVDSNSQGLGLPIVKSIADFHHLTIEVESTVEEGSSFQINFPK